MTVSITERADDKALECVNDDGSTTIYYAGRQVALEVRDIRQAVELSGDSVQGAQALRFLKGMVLDDRDVSVIGEPATATRTLDLRIFDRVIDGRSGDGLGFANLGFNRADMELRTADEWHVSLYLPTTAFDGLSAAAADSQLTSMRLLLMLPVFTTHHPMAPYSHSERLYLRPADAVASLQWPRSADGHIVRIVCEWGLADLVPPADGDHVGDDTDQPPSVAPAQESVTTAILALCGQLERLRKAVKWGFGFVGLVLLFLAVK